jgi:hypothetical protein
MLVLAGGLAVAYAVTPYSAQGPDGLPLQVSANTRYGVPALLVGAALCAVAAGRLGGLRPVAEALGALLALDGVRRAFHVPAHTIALVVVLLVVLLAAAWALRALVPRRRLAPLAALAVLIAAFGVARRLDTHLDYTAWRADPALAWVRAHANGGQRIGLAGLWPTQGGVAPILPAFGDRLDNRVTYLGPFNQHMLRQYATIEPFVARLRREHIGLLIVGRGFPVARAQTREDRWARSAGLRELARSNRFTLYGY